MSRQVKPVFRVNDVVTYRSGPTQAQKLTVVQVIPKHKVILLVFRN